MKILNRNDAIHTLFESFTKRNQGKCEEQLPEKPLGRFSAFVSVCQRLSAVSCLTDGRYVCGGRQLADTL